jgi:hypothetical protein
MGKAIRASVVVLLLACSARAGYMPNGSPEPPPQAGWMGNDSPAPPSASREPTTDGEMSTTSAGSLTQVALDLLAVLPPLY